MPFFLQLDIHAQSLGLVHNHPPGLSIQHLVCFLVRFFAIINRLSYLSNVANYNDLHSCLMESGDKSGRLLVLDGSDLIGKLLQLALLSVNHPLAPL